MTTAQATTAQDQATSAVRTVNARLDKPEDLLERFLDRFKWMTEHDDFFNEVRDFLAEK